MTIRFGLVPTIVASSPQAAEQFLKNHDLIFASRPYHAACHYIFYNQRNLIMAKYGPYWRNMRKLCTLQLLSSVKINSFQPMRKQELEILVNFLKKAAVNQDEVDLSAKVAYLSANMACLMVFGKKYNINEDNKGFKGVIQETSHIAATPNLAELFPFLRFLDLQGLARRMKQVAKSCDEFLENVIDEHVRLSTDKKKQTSDIYNCAG
ncbi:PREDICTED: cytochrome P450 CYP736A12-like [Nicotiana attenuata]|uniref:cytochrome P450 CYP736A12-like n=1 Tax=Nicotiana attenuata TaxID=49451 RepID=UPI0009049647|nr:PREDICTED: cytochrome P450 CYP736A12-like [Nicotiana attenuata]